MLLSIKFIFTSQKLRKQISMHLNETLFHYYDPIWWKFNEVALARELSWIAGAKSVKRIIYHGKHYDGYYLEEISYELNRHIK